FFNAPPTPHLCTLSLHDALPILPATDISVVHRSDASGTTYIWADYLAKVSPEWKMKVGVGNAVMWPTGIGGKGNEGVAGQMYVRSEEHTSELQSRGHLVCRLLLE